MESTGKTTLAIQLADHYKTGFLNLRGIICKRNGIKAFVINDVCYPLLMAKLNLKITACPSLTSICSATQTY
jgi:hypothetical protein